MSFFQAANLRIDLTPSGIAFLKLDVADRPVNVFTPAVFADLDAALRAVADQRSVRLLVLLSDKKSGFAAGADVQQFADVRTAEEAKALSALGQDAFDRLARVAVPTLAIVHGACLGGGLEFALACDYRLAVDLPGTQFAFPEIELGLIPGWGGTQRLPRLIGVERALQMILAARRVGAQQAWTWGLVDGLSSVFPDVSAASEELMLRAIKQGKQPRDWLTLRTWRQVALESNRLGRALIFRGSRRVLQRRVPDDMPAPDEALQVMRLGLDRGMEAGLAAEREAIGRLAVTPACRNLVGLFLQREQARKLPAEARGDDKPVHRIGVVGAGTMGAGIAQLAALKGYEVIVQEVNTDALGMGLFRITSLFDQALERRLLTEEELRRKLGALRGTVKWEGFDAVDLVIEAAVEELAIKRTVFRELEARTRPDTLLATNTSSLTVASLQEGLTHPGRVAALHFFNPVHKMPLVEIGRAPATEGRTVDTLVRWAVALGKTPVVVKDSPGFLVNRVLMPYLNEAVMLVAEGLAIEQVDRAMTRFGMPVGPLELLDQVGLDVAAHIAASMQPVFGDRLVPQPGFARMKERGWLGEKNKTGFYSYRGAKKRVNRGAAALVREGGAVPRFEMTGNQAAGLRLTEGRERMVLLMLNEAAACRGEGLVSEADTLDLAMVLGTGWAPHRGGPLHYLRERGVAEVVQTLQALARRHGPRFEPCAELRGWGGNSDASQESRRDGGH